MKEKIIEIIGHGMEPERASLVADELLRLFLHKETDEKYFAISQHFIDPSFKEKTLLVGKIRASNVGAAKEKYLEENHPNNKAHQDFIAGYLFVFEVSPEQYEKLSKEEIDQNRNIIGPWL